MSVSDKLLRLTQVKENQKTALTAIGQTPSDDWETYPDLIRSASGSGESGMHQLSKTVDADPKGITITPDNPYEGMLSVIIEGDPDFKPWNIVSGIEAWGLTGTAKPKVSSDFPSNLPITEEEMDEEARKRDSGTSIEDKFVLVDNNGNITTGYMDGDNFRITYYDPVTTEFKAEGWTRVSYHATGVNAGTWTTVDFPIGNSSTGWNYFSNLRSCARKNLYYGDLVIWPWKQQYEEWPSAIVYRPDSPGDTGGSYNLHLLKGRANTSFVWSSRLALTVTEPVEGG